MDSSTSLNMETEGGSRPSSIEAFGLCFNYTYIRDAKLIITFVDNHHSSDLHHLDLYLWVHVKKSIYWSTVEINYVEKI